MYNWLSVRDWHKASSDVQLYICTRFWQCHRHLRCTIGLVYMEDAASSNVQLAKCTRSNARHLQMYNWQLVYEILAMIRHALIGLKMPGKSQMYNLVHEKPILH